MDKLYQAYIEANDDFWTVHDQLSELTLTQKDADPKYQEAWEAASQAYEIWLVGVRVSVEKE
jgi:hypothetical protein